MCWFVHYEYVMIGSGSLLVVASINGTLSLLCEKRFCEKGFVMIIVLCPRGFSLDSVHGLVCSLTITSDM